MFSVSGSSLPLLLAFAGLASAGAFLKRLSEGPASRQGDPRARSKEHRARRQRFQYSHTDVSLSGRERADVVTEWRRRRRGQQPTAVAWWAAYPLSALCSCGMLENAETWRLVFLGAFELWRSPEALSFWSWKRLASVFGLRVLWALALEVSGVLGRLFRGASGEVFSVVWVLRALELSLQRLRECPGRRQGDPHARSKEHRARRQRFQYSHTDVSLSGRERADVVTEWRRRRRGQQPTAVAWWAAYPLSARSCEKVETARLVSWGFLVAGGLGRPCFLFQGAACLCCWRLRVLRALERS